MRAADPVHNVELRRNSQGHDSVVFAFPYRADIVDSVRAIPGRRFDWEAKEWWAPRADAVAPFVKGVLERHPTLSVAPDVDGVALARGHGLDRPREHRASSRAAGTSVLDTIAGELDEPLAELAAERGGRLWLPFTRAGRGGAAGDPRRAAGPARAALRLAPAGRPRPRAGLARARRGLRRAALQARHQLGSRRRCPPSSRCPPARRTAARSRSTRTCWSRWSTTCGCSASSRPPTRARCSTGCAASTTPRSTTCAARAPSTPGPLEIEDAARRRAASRSSARASPTRCTPGARSWPTSRASARPCRRSRRWRPTTPTRP